MTDYRDGWVGPLVSNDPWVAYPWCQPSQEMGHTDAIGRRWIHIPWVGWRLQSPSPFIMRPGPRRSWWWRR
jgi:hypothetical protein